MRGRMDPTKTTRCDAGRWPPHRTGSVSVPHTEGRAKVRKWDLANLRKRQLACKLVQHFPKRAGLFFSELYNLLELRFQQTDLHVRCYAIIGPIYQLKRYKGMIYSDPK